jgi:hypothetical protein
VGGSGITPRAHSTVHPDFPQSDLVARAQSGHTHPPERKGDFQSTFLGFFPLPQPPAGDPIAFPRIEDSEVPCTFRKIWRTMISSPTPLRNRELCQRFRRKVRITGLLNAILSKYVPPSHWIAVFLLQWTSHHARKSSQSSSHYRTSFAT